MVHEKRVLKFVKMSKNAFSPSKGSAKAAGYDLKRFVELPIILNAVAILK